MDYEFTSLNALQAVSGGVDEVLVVVVVFAYEGVPFMDVGEGGVVDS